MEALLRHIARLTFHHHRLTLLLVFFLTVIAGFFASKLELRTNFVSLLPQQSRSVKVFFESIEDFGMSDFFIVCLESDDDRYAEKMMDFADAIVEELADSSLIEYIDYRLGDREKDFFRKIFLQRMPLFLDQKGVQRLEELLTDESIRGSIRRNRELVSSQVGLAVKKLIIEDPLNLATIYQDYLPGQKGNLEFDLTDSYYISRDSTMLLILIKPTKAIGDIDYNRSLLHAVEMAVTEARNRVSDDEADVHDATTSPISVGYTGAHVITVADTEVIRRDMIQTVIGSFIGIMVLFLIAFRRLETLLYIGLPLIVGVVWTLGFSYLTIGSLNLITSVLSAIILGLGVDFAIHIYSRFLDELARGNTVEESLAISLASTGKGTFTGALTTAAAFFAMTIAPFRGLSEFGFMAGSGIILCFFSVCLTLPPMIRLRIRHHERHRDRVAMHSFFIEHLIKPSLRYPGITLIAGIIITLAALTQLPRVTFSDSIANLRAQSNIYMRVRDRVSEKIGGNLSYFMVVVRGDSLDAAILHNERLHAGLQQLVNMHKMTMISSLTDYIPPIERQNTIISLLRDDVKLSSGRIRATFLQALEENGFRLIPEYQTYIDMLCDSLSNQRPLTFDDYQTVGLERFLRRFIVHRDDEFRLALYLFPSDRNDLSQSAVLDDLLANIETIFSENGVEADITGSIIVTRELKLSVIESINNVTSIAFILVILVLSLHFRRLRPVVGSLIPMGLGVILMLGTMPMAGLELNIFNIAIIPIIVGIGIDDGVHILHRFQQGRRDIHEVLLHSGKAVIMTSLTTIIAFGSLYFSDYKGLATMGYLAITGVGLSLLTTLTILPAMILIWSRFRLWRAKGNI